MKNASWVADNNGVMWEVKRRWVPRWARVEYRKRIFWWKRKENKTHDHFDVPIEGFDLGDGAIVLVVLVVALLLVWFVLLPVLLILFDILVVIILLIVGIVTRILFRRPWDVTAESENGQIIVREVYGWRASGEEREALKRSIEIGLTS